jgi:hypothetical protein
MPSIVPNNLNSFSNIPLPPSTSRNNYSFPNDLVANGRNFTTNINFVSYQSTTNLLGSALAGLERSMGSRTIPAGGVVLPIPKKINDVQTVVWSQESMSGVAGSMASSMMPYGSGSLLAAAGGAATAIGAGMGVTLNPYLYMAFKNPAYKEHTLQWTLAPNNEQESNTLANIIKFFKYNMLPATAGPLYTYPCIAKVSLQPNDFFTMQFKPCAVTSVSVDFTGAGGPSFFRNGAPTVVNLTVQMKEIELWTKDDYNGGSAIITAGEIGSAIGSVVGSAVGSVVSAVRNIF